MTLKPNQVFKFLLLSFILLLTGNLLSIYLILEKGYMYEKSIVRIFSFDLEQNLPAFFSTGLFLLSATLLFLIGRNKKSKYKLHWLALSVIFFFLALDEAISIHELFNYSMRNVFGATGYFHFAWVIPYAVLAILVLIAFTKFLLALPKRTTLIMILAGILFVSGAIGMEMIAANYVNEFGDYQYIGTYMAFFTIEESLEMLGLILFIYGLLDFMGLTNLKPLKLKVKGK